MPLDGIPAIGRLPAFPSNLSSLSAVDAPALAVPLLLESATTPEPAVAQAAELPSIAGVEVNRSPAGRVEDPRRENIKIWDAFLAQASRKRNPEELLQALRASGGGPLQGEGRLVFVSQEPGFVAGSFNDWRGDATPLVSLGGGLFAADMRIGNDRRVSYKFVRNGVWRGDPLARWVEWDGIDTGGVGGFNSVAFSGRGAALRDSELYRLPLFVSAALGNAREVFVQVPAQYLERPSPLPLVILQDGNESLTRGRFDRGIDAARAAGGLAPALVAYVALHDQSERMQDYTFATPGARAERYEKYIVAELLPRLEAAFLTPGKPEQRAIGGASLGGLIAYRIALDRPDIFARALSQSGSFQWAEERLISEVAARRALAGRWYLDAGSDEHDNGVVAARMRAALEAAGAAAIYVRDPEARHEWGDWAKRLPDALAALLR